ncbi:hypothetical protein RHSIM_Rhsim11G0124500 [Rhododendron simsii]|uniref:Uncharacterized protein n=1 Tax=Rhododendron simsii TaxID=118357 RepID=A0A834G6Y4_RHOSS|nr:hypothetical protein RHSIM_Rhsim11G0124500 [Rhododendron simsii]
MVATRELALKHLRSELKGARKKCPAARVALYQFMDHSFGSGATFTFEENVAISKRIQFLYLKDKEANEKLKALQDQIKLEEAKKYQHKFEIWKEETDRKAARSVSV